MAATGSGELGNGAFQKPGLTILFWSVATQHRCRIYCL